MEEWVNLEIVSFELEEFQELEEWCELEELCFSLE